jgi:hypothetical protein
VLKLFKKTENLDIFADDVADEINVDVMSVGRRTVDEMSVYE